MKQHVIVTENNGIATVALNRPEKKNALNIELIQALVDAGTQLSDRRDIRAVILTGAGNTFCAGLDVAAMPKIAAFANEAGGIMKRTHGTSNIFQATSTIWAGLPMPVIAAVSGYAFGGGFQIMLGADIRIAAPDTRFSIMETKWGLVPDMGGMVAMHRLARADVIRRLTYTAEIFDGTAALDWGFVTELAADPMARATALAAEIARRSPDAVRTAKSLINATATMNEAEILLEESRAQGTLIGQPNQIESVMAGFENRPPNFSD